MPVHMYNLTVEALARAGKKPSYANVAILGWSFLNNSDDARNPRMSLIGRCCLTQGKTRILPKVGV
jgi:UDP-N-acetyl-D-mannosaminuronic acid dehydrogenase